MFKNMKSGTKSLLASMNVATITLILGGDEMARLAEKTA
jgi:hypothetical protein